VLSLKKETFNSSKFKSLSQSRLQKLLVGKRSMDVEHTPMVGLQASIIGANLIFPKNTFLENYFFEDGVL